MKNELVTATVDGNSIQSQTDYATTRNAKALNLIIRVYQLTAPALAVIALLLYLADVVINVVRLCKRRSTNLSRCLIQFGMLLTIWVNLVVVSINYFETDPHDFREYYAAGVYPIWQVFVCLSVLAFVNYAISYVKDKKALKAANETKDEYMKKD